ASVNGKFRPSVAARRMGEVGLELERLLVLQKHTLQEACEILRSRGHSFADDELRALALRLPVRRAQIVVMDPGDLEHLLPDGRSDDQERRQSRDDLLKQLVPLLRELPLQ